MKFIEQAWHIYRQEVMPKEVSFAQFVETRRAFYAGAQAFATKLDACAGDPVAVERMRAELEAFAAAVEAGKA